MKHTPGPWKRSGKSGINGGNRVVAMTSGIGDEQADADARLISAAPELLEIVSQLIGLSALGMSREHRHGLSETEVIERALQLIAKATGGDK